MSQPTAYPLCWPPGWERTNPHRREYGRFKKRSAYDAARGLRAEAERWRAAHIIVSANFKLRLDGLPYAQQPNIDDPGVAIYLKRRNQDYVLACDAFDKIWKNMRALTLALESLRRLERYGCEQLMNTAFEGFKALPPGEEPMTPERALELFGLREDADPEVIQVVYRRLAKKHHPDGGGDERRFREIRAAYEMLTGKENADA